MTSSTSPQGQHQRAASTNALPTPPHPDRSISRPSTAIPSTNRLSPQRSSIADVDRFSAPGTDFSLPARGSSPFVTQLSETDRQLLDDYDLQMAMALSLSMESKAVASEPVNDLMSFSDDEKDAPKSVEVPPETSHETTHE
jgi:hypothetical protein